MEYKSDIRINDLLLVLETANNHSKRGMALFGKDPAFYQFHIDRMKKTSELINELENYKKDYNY